MLCPPKREGPLDLPAATARIGYRACAATHITGDLNVTAPDIAAEAFSEATIDGALTLGSGIDKASEQAFSNINIGGSMSIDCPLSLKAFEKATIGGDLTVGSQSNIGLGALSSVKVKGNTVISSAAIAERAFYGSTFLGDLTLTADIATLGQEAFQKSKVSGALTVGCALSAKAFEQLTLQGDLVIAESVGSIPEGAFAGLNTPNSLIINTPEVGINAFRSATIGADLRFGEHAAKISENAFYGATVAGEVEIGASIENLGSKAFYEANVGKLTIGCKAIGDETFKLATIAKDFTLQEPLEEIGSAAFQGLKCDGLSLHLPPSLRTIGNDAFKMAQFTGSFEVPETVATIGAGAFYGNLFTEIKLSGTTEYGGSGEFTGYLGWDDYQPSMWNKDNILLSCDNPQGAFTKSQLLESITIPTDLKVISPFMFSNSLHLKQVLFAEQSQLEKICRGAFFDCPLEELILPQPVHNDIELGMFTFFQSDIDNRARKVFLPPCTEEASIKKSNTGFLVGSNSDIVTPNDEIYLWVDDNQIENDLLYVTYAHWYNYPNYNNYAWGYDDRLGWFDYPPEEFMMSWGECKNCYLMGNGLLYIPRGMSTKLIEYLKSKIIGPIVDYASEHATPAYIYPVYFYIPYENWIEIDMYDYPYCELNPIPGGVEQLVSNSSAATEVARYDINGRLLSSSQSGINIVRYSDGTVKKELKR